MTNMQLAEVEPSLEEVHLDDTSKDRIQGAEDIANIVQQIEEERSALNPALKLLERLLSRVRDLQTTGDVNIGSTTLAGFTTSFPSPPGTLLNRTPIPTLGNHELDVATGQ